MSLLTEKEQLKVYEEIAEEVWMSVGELKNGFPHGCEEWKAFTKRKKEIRKKLWQFFIGVSFEGGRK